MDSLRLLRLPPGQPPRQMNPDEAAHRRERDREVAEYIVLKGRGQVSPEEAAEEVARMNLANLVLMEMAMRKYHTTLHQIEYQPYG